MEKCKAESATCKRELEMLDKSPEKWKVEIGAKGSCAPFIVGCTSHAAGGGGTIRLVPSEYKLGAQLVGVKVTSTAVLGHEAGHALTDRITACQPNGDVEHCAKQHENAVRMDANLPKRP